MFFLFLFVLICLFPTGIRNGGWCAFNSLGSYAKVSTVLVHSSYYNTFGMFCRCLRLLPPAYVTKIGMIYVANTTD